MSSQEFDDDEDLLGLREFGEMLKSWVKSSDPPTSFLVHAPWGAGKTIFSKQWENLIAQDMLAVRVDAFESDLSDNAFEAIIAALYKCAEEQTDDSIRKTFLDKAASIGATIKKYGPSLLGRALVKVALPSDDDTQEAVEDFSAELSGRAAEAMFSKDVKELAKRQQKISQLTQSLTEMAKALQKDRIILIVDELDRCRPEFATEVLDVLLHVFAEAGLSSIIFADIDMLRSLVQSKFGSKLHSRNYVEKFFDVQIELPTGNTPDSSGINRYEKFTRSIIGRHSKSQYLQNIDIARVYFELSAFNNSSYRLIQKCINHLALTGSPLGLTQTNATILAILIWLKYHHEVPKALYSGSAYIGDLDPFIPPATEKYCPESRYLLDHLIEYEKKEGVGTRLNPSPSQIMNQLWKTVVHPIEISS